MNQGKRKDQINFSEKLIGYSYIGFIVLFIALFILRFLKLMPS